VKRIGVEDLFRIKKFQKLDKKNTLEATIFFHKLPCRSRNQDIKKRLVWSCPINILIKQGILQRVRRHALKVSKGKFSVFNINSKL